MLLVAMAVHVQSDHTVFSGQGPSSAYGYEPQRRPKQQVKKHVAAANTAADTNAFVAMYGQVLPLYWMLHPDGHPITHANAWWTTMQASM